MAMKKFGVRWARPRDCERAASTLSILGNPFLPRRDLERSRCQLTQHDLRILLSTHLASIEQAHVLVASNTNHYACILHLRKLRAFAAICRRATTKFTT